MDTWVGKIPWRRDRLPTLVFLGFTCDSAGRESACNAGVLGLIPGLGRSPGEGKGDLFTCTPSSILARRIPWTVHGDTESDTTERLSLSIFTFFTTSATWESHSSIACSFLDSSLALSSLNSSFLKLSSQVCPTSSPPFFLCSPTLMALSNSLGPGLSWWTVCAKPKS